MSDLFDTPAPPPVPTSRQVISVSELNRRAKSLLELHLPLLWVEGELSNFSRPSSGHWYFTLKDDSAQVRCAMFRSRNATLKISPKVGDKVIVRAKTSLYEGRGDYQLIVEHMEDAGFGLLQKRYEALKDLLNQQGLFSAEHKKSLPNLAQHIAIITSPTGAAIRDVVAVMQRRFPATRLSILPVAVQGEGAADQMIEAVKWANTAQRFDVILLCRGGGSIEDLWAYNNEALAHCIFESQLPVVSAVGHEIDFTIADFVADVRAPTPSAAAELLSPDQSELAQTLLQHERSLARNIRAILNHAKQHLSGAQRLLRHPGQQIQNWSQRLDQLELRLLQTCHQTLTDHRKNLSTLQKRLSTQKPAAEIARNQLLTTELTLRLQKALSKSLKDKRMAIDKASGMLNLVSPLNTLERGYSITRKQNGEVVRNTEQVASGDILQVMLHHGELQVTTVNPKKN
ncbi:exodeoxyribonuclease VII large subunit [Alteromonadaceae bacterium 2753L.S.0a.02]|nr:exodeoxyribonuclease VII large subunit [Alteromonadaceae bacterium 2753L.S.0a.02]